MDEAELPDPGKGKALDLSVLSCGVLGFRRRLLFWKGDGRAAGGVGLPRRERVGVLGFCSQSRNAASLRHIG